MRSSTGRSDVGTERLVASPIRGRADELSVIGASVTAVSQVDTHKADRGPLLLTSGTEDHTGPLKVTKEVVAMYSKGPAHTDFHIFEGRGHSLTIDNGWKDVADVALQWLATNGL